MLRAIKVKHNRGMHMVAQVICLTEFKPDECDMLRKQYARLVWDVFEGKLWGVPPPTIAKQGSIVFLVVHSISPNVPEREGAGSVHLLKGPASFRLRCHQSRKHS